MESKTEAARAQIRKTSGKASGALAEHLEMLFRYKYAVMDQLIGLPGGGIESAGGIDREEKGPFPLTELLEPPGRIIEGADTATTECAGSRGVPVVVPEAVKDLRFRPEHCPVIDDAEAARHNERSVRGMDIMMAVAGEHRCRCAILPLMHPGAVLGPGCIALRADAERCNPFYLNNVLHQYLHTGYLERIVSSNGNVDTARLLSLRIPLPSPEEQRRIADRLLNISACIVDTEEAGAMIGRTIDIL